MPSDFRIGLSTHRSSRSAAAHSKLFKSWQTRSIPQTGLRNRIDWLKNSAPGRIFGRTYADKFKQASNKDVTAPKVKGPEMKRSFRQFYGYTKQNHPIVLEAEPDGFDRLPDRYCLICPNLAVAEMTYMATLRIRRWQSPYPAGK